jgi:alpha-tubulin suppressor-like RCC1 family protein
LGIDSIANRSSPIQVGSDLWNSVSAAEGHSAAIRNDGALFTWGVGTSGRLGLNDVISRSSPTQVGSSSWTQVTAGTTHTAGILNNNLIYSWGNDGNGQLGLGTVGGIQISPVVLQSTQSTSSPIQIGSSSWSMVSAGRYGVAAIDSRNLLFTWGFNPGTLGLNDNISRSLPTQVGPSSWISVGSGDRWTAAIRSDGALFTWGLGSYGRLGNESTLTRSSPIQIGSATNWKEVSAGGSHGVALKS